MGKSRIDMLNWTMSILFLVNLVMIQSTTSHYDVIWKGVHIGNEISSDEF